VSVRPETPADAAAIAEVNTFAFGQHDEARLVEALRSSAAFIPELSLVALEGGEIAGHILLTRLCLRGDDGADREALALAPLAVLPAWQRRGIGSALVAAAHAAAARLGHAAVVVLGHQEYYPRFGFRPASAFGIRCPFEGVADAAFLALELRPGALRGFSGTPRYPDAFGVPPPDSGRE